MAPQAPPFVSCPAGAPLGALDLQAQTGDQRLPLRTLNHLSEGDTVLYSPVVRGKEKRPGEVALVLVPERRMAGQEDILVTEPKPADRPQSWQIQQTTSIAALVYGPAGLSRKKVLGFLSQDEILVAQLADYADKTAQAEQLVSTLSNSESSSASVNAALSGFASEYGFALAINKSAPVQTQAAAVFATMNPQLAAYNPLVSSTAQRAGQTASLATMAGALFFGSPIGLVAGGTAMLLDLRAIAAPDTQFRASFAQPVTNSTSVVNLCGQQGPLPPHARAAYIWAIRIPNISAPAIRIGHADFVATRQKTPVPVDVSDPGWKYLDRVRAWTLSSGQKKLPVSVVALSNQRALEIDLTKADVPPGDYKLNGFWDWTPLQATGTVHVRTLSDFKEAHLNPESQDRLLAKSGRVPVTLEGSDFEFTTGVELQKVNDEFATAEGVRYLLPKGEREGPQSHMDVQIDTQSLDPGVYKLLISQPDGKSHAVGFKVLPSPPNIENLPIVLNQGAVTHRFILKGERLELIRELEAPGVVLRLSPPGTRQTERAVSVELKSLPPSGTALPMTANIEDRTQPLTFTRAIEITGPTPVIAGARISPPKQMSVAFNAGEFPAGATLNAMLDVKNTERQSTLRLGCADGVGPQTTLHIGEQTPGWSLQQLSTNQLFLAFDTTGLPAGCSLEATIDQARDGSSPAFALAHILRLPEIDSLTVTDAPRQEGMRQFQLTGQNLELIRKVGWDENNGLEISALPAPLPGPGLKQSIQIALPEPGGESSLYVWLWGDRQGRETRILAQAPLSVESPPATDWTTDGATRLKQSPSAASVEGQIDER